MGLFLLNEGSIFIKKNIKLVELRQKRELYSLTPSLWPALPGMAPCLLASPAARPLTFLWTAVPGSHTQKALCHTALSNFTWRSSLLALNTWIPDGVPGTPDSGSPVCELEARSHRGKGTLWLKCIFSNLCATELLLLYSPREREPSKCLGIWDSQCMLTRGNYASLRHFPGLQEAFGGRVL